MEKENNFAKVRNAVTLILYLEFVPTVGDQHRRKKSSLTLVHKTLEVML